MGDNYSAWQAAPPKRYSFNWKQPKEKITMNPVLTPASDAGGDASYGPGKSWIPCVVVTMERDVPDDNASQHNLEINYVSHFTYTDN
jgi:hypothetical protein